METHGCKRHTSSIFSVERYNLRFILIVPMIHIRERSAVNVTLSQCVMKVQFVVTKITCTVYKFMNRL